MRNKVDNKTDNLLGLCIKFIQMKPVHFSAIEYGYFYVIA